MTKQAGSIHVIILVSILTLVTGALAVVLWTNFLSPKSILPGAVSLGGNKDHKSEEVKLKTYTSTSGSGLTFDYPESWSFEEPTEQQISREDSKATIMMLYSKKPSIVDDKVSIATNNMCVTFNEMQGNWPFRAQPLKYSSKIADFNIGQKPVSLVKNDDNLIDAVSPAIQIINQDASAEHGGAYIALNNDYFLLATAAKDCWLADGAERKDIATEIEQTYEILKSVRIKD